MDERTRGEQAGWAILGEQVSAVALLGTGIVVVGIVITTRNLPS